MILFQSLYVALCWSLLLRDHISAELREIDYAELIIIMLLLLHSTSLRNLIVKNVMNTTFQKFEVCDIWVFVSKSLILN